MRAVLQMRHTFIDIHQGPRQDVDGHTTPALLTSVGLLYPLGVLPQQFSRTDMTVEFYWWLTQHFDQLWGK